ncbi:DUF6949 family protein [Rhodobium gokarnense]|uniref:Uncharacterized protein n=1 Tax=Rhodobium gokarnense TaxID=364296 RepID=A0ABT3HDG7_9HYPH|nr:hypothetical protein [Rhodobium gokarnense]MCW2308448.1 hypothetical protein [Rhodobium gokarnense]
MKGTPMIAGELLVVGYAIATGFVAAGMLGSFYQLLTRRPPSFVLSVDTWWTIISSTVMCAFAGPFIIMRNALRGRRIEHRPLGWLAASTAIAAGWSLCSGIVVLEMTLSVVS